jgi:dihydropteroate synthase
MHNTLPNLPPPPARVLRAGDHTLQLGSRPWLMGVVNASPDSFSDDGSARTLDRRVQLARSLVEGGADVLDVGGESARTDTPSVSVAEEVERVVPLVQRISAEVDTIVSVDTYKPVVARAAIAAGATIVNDVSGLHDPELARVCADTGAALVLMHTRVAPKQRLQDPELYDGDVTGEVLLFLRGRIELALAAGVASEQLIVDPGPDFAKTPAQTIALLADVDRLHELGRPLLMAISRKDFIGALTSRPPRERLAGTLAALAHGLDHGAHMFRVHDIDAAADFVRVRAALRGELHPGRDLTLAEELRHER